MKSMKKKDAEPKNTKNNGDDYPRATIGGNEENFSCFQEKFSFKKSLRQDPEERGAAALTSPLFRGSHPQSEHICCALAYGERLPDSAFSLTFCSPKRREGAHG